MDAEWVEVLHRSHRKAVVVLVADTFKLYLFPSFQTFFHKNLWSEGKGTFGYFAERLLIGTDARAQAAQCIG